MNKIVKVDSVGGSLYMSSSKSLLHRYLILASRSKDVLFEARNLSDDVLKTIEILRTLGTEIEISQGSGKNEEHGKTYIRITGYKKSFPSHIDFGESGSSLRFLLSQCFLEERDISFTASPRLMERPIEDLVRHLKGQGVSFSSDRLPFHAVGRIRSWDFETRADLSSQYVTSLMMTAIGIDWENNPNTSLNIRVDGPIRSFSYVKMTRDIMEELGYGVAISNDGSKIKVDKGPREIRGFFKVEGDWSNAILAIGLALLKGEVKVYNLKKDSFQGDMALVEILKKMGADIGWVDDHLLVKKSRLKPIDINLDENIDLFPVLSVLALGADGESRFRGLDRLRLKESDRLKGVYDLHKAMGVASYIDNEDFVAVPGRVRSFNFSSRNDHRLVMAAVLAAGLAPIDVSIEGFEAINKSYRGFERDMTFLGVKIIDLNKEL